jgi:hypothetical protein
MLRGQEKKPERQAPFRLRPGAGFLLAAGPIEAPSDGSRVRLLAANGLSLFAPPDGFEIASLRPPEMGIEVPDQVVVLRRFSRFTF